MMKSNKESNISDLHESLLIIILTFLPVQAIIRCTRVCKIWATLISQPYFIKHYESTKKSGSIQLLLEDRSTLMKPNNLFLAELDEAACIADSPEDLIIPIKTRFPLKFLDDLRPYMLKVISTCSVTGWIAASRYDGLEPPVSHHIFNPVTGQHILVEDVETIRRWPRCALLYVPQTEQFKFLYFGRWSRSWSLDMEQVGVEIQTCNNGTNNFMWRRIGTLPFYPIQHTHPIFANGLYHWIDPRKKIIYSFNAETEVFHQIQTPPRIRCFMRSNLGLLEDCLCIVMKFVSIEIWVLLSHEDGTGGKKSSWTKKFVIRKLVIDPDLILEPLKCLENGEIVILQYPRYAISYNPSTESCKYIRFGEKPIIRYRPFSYFGASLRNILPPTT